MSSHPGRAGDPRPSFDEALGDASHRVAAQGDMLDRVRWTRVSPTFGGKIALSGAVLWGAQAATGSETNEMILSAPVAILGALAINSLVRPASRASQARRITDLKKSFEDMSDTLKGDAVSVFTANKTQRDKWRVRSVRSLHLLWEPTEDKYEDTGDLIKNLRTVNAAAKNRRVATVTIPAEVVGLAAEEDTKNIVLQSRADWLASVKGNKVQDKLNPGEVAKLSPAQVDKLIYNIEHNTTRQLQTYLSIIRELRPNHPCLKYDGEGTQKQVQLRKSLTRRIEGKTVEVGTHTVEAGPYIERRKHHRLASLFVSRKGVPMVRWRSPDSNQPEDFSTLISASGISANELLDLGKNYQNMPKHRAVAIAELGAWMASHKVLDNIVSGLKPRNSAKPTHERSLRNFQQRIAERLLHKEPPKDASERTGISIKGGLGSARLFRAWGMGSMAAFVFAPAVMHGVYTINKDVESDSPAAKITGVPIAFSKSFQAFVNSGARRLTGINTHTSSGSPDKPSEYQPPIDDRLNSVGNVKTSQPQPVWYIESRNGMDSAGYWSQQVDHVINDSPVEWVQSGPVVESKINPYTPDYFDFDRQDSYVSRLANTPDAALPSALDITKPLLRVQREVQLPEADGWINGFRVLSVPVLDNGEIAAASINGNIPVKIITLQNNTQVMMMRNAPAMDKPVRVEYWIKESPGRTELAVDNVIGTDGIELKTNKNIWEDTIDIPADPQKRLQLQASYLRMRFKYRTSPMDSDKRPRGIDRYMRTVIALGKANCNTANTELVLSNPRQLNYASGFFNTNTGKQVAQNQMHLSTNEAHAWSVDRSGKKYDATPQSGLTDKDKDFFKEDYAKGFGERSTLLQKGLLVFGGLAGAGLLASQKRRFDRRAARKKLNATSDDEQIRAFNTLSNVLYSRGEIGSATARDGKTPEQLWADFTRLHNPAAVDKEISDMIINRQIPFGTIKLAKEAVALQKANAVIAGN
jgi:hypothetical protein